MDDRINTGAIKMGGPGSSVGIATDYTPPGSNPSGARFSARPDRPWGPPSFLYNGYQVFPGGKIGQGVLLTTHPLLVLWSWKSRAIPLLTLWATTGPVTGTLYLLKLKWTQLKYYKTVIFCLITVLNEDQMKN